MMRLLPLTRLLSALTVIHVLECYACERGTVRDAAFLKPRDVHRLCVFGTSANSESVQIRARLDDWLQGNGNGMNLSVEFVDVDSPGVDWKSFGIPSAPPRVPAVALIGVSVPAGNPFVITAWEPGPSVEELDALAASATCREIRGALSTNWAVLLHVPGNSPGVSATLDHVQARWAQEQAPGVSIVRLVGDGPGERMLRRFMSIPKDGSDWIGVLFGKGKLLAPPLAGSSIGEQPLNALLESLAVQCTCLHESVRLGVDLPMMWDESITEAALSLSTTEPVGLVAYENAVTGIAGYRFYLLLGLGVLFAAGSAMLAAWPRRKKT